VGGKVFEDGFGCGKFQGISEEVRCGVSCCEGVFGGESSVVKRRGGVMRGGPVAGGGESNAWGHIREEKGRGEILGR